MIITGLPVYFHFYPRPPRGGRPGWQQRRYVQNQISIHALREEGDDLAVNPKAQNRIFLSTPSARRATDDPCPWYCARSDFYPRPPRGGRQITTAQTAADKAFLSTPSARRATVKLCRGDRHGRPISIHALREEGDFNVCSDWQCVDLISIHALREEGDL